MQNGKNIESIDDVIEISNNYKKCEGKGIPLTWYRGQSKHWNLYTGVYRQNSDHFHTFIEQAIEAYKNDPEYKDEDGNPLVMKCMMSQEYSMITAFMRQATPFFTTDMTLVEKYFIMQHHGFPTRLLDWTANPLIALYFACSDEKYKKDDGYIYAINPKNFISQKPIEKITHMLNDMIDKDIINNKDTLDACTRELQQLLDDYPDDVVGAEHPYVQFTVKLITTPSVTFNIAIKCAAYATVALVLPIHPTILRGRLLQQDARFTLDMPFIEQRNGERTRFFESYITRHLIPSKMKAELLKRLECIGIDEALVYYDLDSLSRSFKKIYTPNKLENCEKATT